MLTLRHTVIVAALAVSTTAAAQPSHLSDVQYMQAARCRALIASPSLGKEDTSRIDGLLKAEGSSRVTYIADKADEMQRDAARMAAGASPERKASLIAERDGVCAAYNSSTIATSKAPATAN
jgi:hypothetical protein